MNYCKRLYLLVCNDGMIRYIYIEIMIRDATLPCKRDSCTYSRCYVLLLIRAKDEYSLVHRKRNCGEFIVKELQCRFNWFEENVSLLSLSSTSRRARNQRNFKLTEAQSSRKAVTTDKSITKINSFSAKSLILYSDIFDRP